MILNKNCSKFKLGFTAVEVMIALIVASIFLIAGHQLYSMIMKSQLYTKVRSEASNIAYAHLRDRANLITSADCPVHYPYYNSFDESPLPNEKMTGLQIKTYVSAPYGCSERVLKVEVEVKYKINDSEQVEKQVLYVNKT